MSGAEERAEADLAALRELGWRGRDARWIRLVCQHSGMFLRAQYCFLHGCHRSTASRFVKRLVGRGIAQERPVPRAATGRPPTLCHIFAKPVYRALGAPDVRFRKYPADTTLVWRRLLSLDAVIEDPDRAWLPTEADKVRYCETLGIPRGGLPSKTYRNPVTGDATVRYFAPLKLPVAGSPRWATFVYADPGRDTASELSTWAEEHAPLWSALRDARVHVDIAVVARTVAGAGHAERWLKARTNGDGGAGRGEEEETFRRLTTAIENVDRELLARHGGFTAAVRLHATLARRLRAPRSLSADTFSARVADRVAGDGYEG